MEAEPMSGLVVVAGVLVGGFVGGMAGQVAGLIWADMELGNLGALGYIAGGIAVGACIGAYVAAELVG